MSIREKGDAASFLPNDIILRFSRAAFRTERCGQAQAIGGPLLPWVASEGAVSRNAHSHLLLFLCREDPPGAFLAVRAITIN